MRVTGEVGAFHLSSQVDNGSTRMIWRVIDDFQRLKRSC
jgi:hypothetical protein